MMSSEATRHRCLLLLLLLSTFVVGSQTLTRTQRRHHRNLSHSRNRSRQGEVHNRFEKNPDVMREIWKEEQRILNNARRGVNNQNSWTGLHNSNLNPTPGTDSPPDQHRQNTRRNRRTRYPKSSRTRKSLSPYVNLRHFRRGTEASHPPADSYSDSETQQQAAKKPKIKWSKRRLMRRLLRKRRNPIKKEDQFATTTDQPMTREPLDWKFTQFHQTSVDTEDKVDTDVDDIDASEEELTNDNEDDQLSEYSFIKNDLNSIPTQLPSDEETEEEEEEDEEELNEGQLGINNVHFLENLIAEEEEKEEREAENHLQLKQQQNKRREQLTLPTLLPSSLTPRRLWRFRTRTPLQPSQPTQPTQPSQPAQPTQPTQSTQPTLPWRTLTWPPVQGLNSSRRQLRPVTRWRTVNSEAGQGQYGSPNGRRRESILPVCNPRTCRPPECTCASYTHPGRFPVDKVPMMVMLTFDDAVLSWNFELFQRITSQGIRNPNGCPMKMTFFVCDDGSNDYDLTRQLYMQGHEIASHSQTHRYPESWWAYDADYDDYRKEFVGQRLKLARRARIPRRMIKGLRAPYLNLNGDTMMEMAKDFEFSYDSSCVGSNPVGYGQRPLWPYTLDHPPTREMCEQETRPTIPYPGLWEVPLTKYSCDDRDESVRGNYMIDECSGRLGNNTSGDVLNSLWRQFSHHYQSRAPMGIFTHATFLRDRPEAMSGLLDFVRGLSTMQDVWLVTVSQVLDWMRSPTSTDDLARLASWNC